MLWSFSSLFDKVLLFAATDPLVKNPLYVDFIVFQGVCFIDRISGSISLSVVRIRLGWVRFQLCDRDHRMYFHQRRKFQLVSQLSNLCNDFKRPVLCCDSFLFFSPRKEYPRFHQIPSINTPYTFFSFGSSQTVLSCLLGLLAFRSSKSPRSLLRLCNFGSFSAMNFK